MLPAEQLQMRLPIHASHQSAAQLFWSASRVHFHCATINVHGSVTQLTCEIVVIIYYNIFLPLFLTLLSDNFVLLSPLPP